MPVSADGMCFSGGIYGTYPQAVDIIVDKNLNDQQNEVFLLKGIALRRGVR
jgi:hypothetical protein